jgi:CheY-like chemotaxis protein
VSLSIVYIQTPKNRLVENRPGILMAITNSTGLLLSDDLIFTSRIVGTGRDLGFTIKTARSGELVLELARRENPRCVIVDLANPGLNIGDLILQLGEVCRPRPFIAAYGSHVDTATLRAARDAGCDTVWPRSKFVEELPGSLPEWFGTAPAKPNQ